MIKKINILKIFLITLISISILVINKSIFFDIINRVGMNGILVLSMIPSICCGIGLNFGISIGILCGLLSTVISIELNLYHINGFIFSILFSIILSIITGIVYGKILNLFKDNEMTVSTYIGFASTSLMSIFWIIIPFKSPDMILTIGGKGLRNTISLENSFGNIFNTYQNIIFFLLICLIFNIFFNTKTGIAMKTVGINPKYAINCGINPNKYRILGTILSNILSAIGIIIYSANYGYIQLYQSPLMMPFPIVASILLGGASIKKASISNAIIGVFIFQTLITISTPLINIVLKDSSLSDSIRMSLSYGIILFNFVKQGGKIKND